MHLQIEVEFDNDTISEEVVSEIINLKLNSYFAAIDFNVIRRFQQNRKKIE